ncbi:hypothetical protein AAG906_023652 [Vitis piasezkii]
MVSKYQSNPCMEHWMMVILKYLQRMRDYMLVYHCNELLPLGYIDLDFQFDRDSRKSTADFVFTLGGGAVSWKSVKQSYIANSTMEFEYVLHKFLSGLGVVPLVVPSLVPFCDNSGTMTQPKELRN